MWAFVEVGLVFMNRQLLNTPIIQSFHHSIIILLTAIDYLFTSFMDRHWMDFVKKQERNPMLLESNWWALHASSAITTVYSKEYVKMNSFIPNWRNCEIFWLIISGETLQLTEKGVWLYFLHIDHLFRKSSILFVTLHPSVQQPSSVSRRKTVKLWKWRRKARLNHLPPNISKKVWNPNHSVRLLRYWR